VSGAANFGRNRWTFSLRWLPDQIDRAAWRTTLTYRFHPRLTAGAEWNPKVREFKPLVNFLLVTETAKRPAIMLGTSTDRLGTPSGQSFYATFSKNLRRESGLPIAPYAGIVYGTYEHRWLPLAGVAISLRRRLSATVSYNGVDTHGMLNYAFDRHVLSLVMVRMRDPGLSYSIVF
jgi:hypothetical protein